MPDDSTNPQTSGDKTAAKPQKTAPVEPAGPSNNAEYEHLLTDLEQSQAKLDEMTNIAKSALADLQNFRRRTEEEQKSFVVYANAMLLKDFLPALENLNRAMSHEPKDAEWMKGLEQTAKQFWQILEKQNVKPIEAVGQKFDPKIHEALLTAPGEKDLVLEELEKGYMIGERVLKPARVKVGNGEAAA